MEFVLWGAAFIAGVYVEQRFAVWSKMKAAYDWIKAKF